MYKKIEARCIAENRLPTTEEMLDLVKAKDIDNGRKGAQELRKRHGENAHSLIGKLGAQKRWANYRKNQKLDKGKKS
jgi:hypothetical protein